MLTSEEIIKDLNETQLKINMCLKDSENSPSFEELKLYSEKMSVIVTWFMQNGYVES